MTTEFAKFSVSIWTLARALASRRPPPLLRRLLSRHGDADDVHGRDDAIRALGGLGDGQLHPFDPSSEGVALAPESGETGAPLSSPTSEPSLAEKTIAWVIGMAPSPTFLPSR